jgi:ech hydrogenase subunit D
MLKEEIPVNIDSVVGETAKMKIDGYRFVTMSCVALDENTFEILYHLDKDFRLKHLRLTVSNSISVPSISPVYFAAFLVENEIQDLFGLSFKKLAIDYKRSLYLEKDVTVTPFCRYTVKESCKNELQSSPVSADKSTLEEY